MISDQTLRLSVIRGIISEAQAASLRGLETEIANSEFRPVVDDEKLRFVSGFGDIFVVIGIAMVFGASAYFLRDFQPLWLASGILAALTWALAELFSRRQRMAFPSIVLLLLFTTSAFFALFLLLAGFVGSSYWMGVAFFLSAKHPVALMSASLGACCVVALHYLRFRVPITIAAGMACFSGAVLALCFYVVPSIFKSHSVWLVLVLGLMIFSLALWYDANDLARETRRTDIAFWLHILAAPMVVHSLIGGFLITPKAMEPSEALFVLAVFLMLSIVALLIDRRAILVSGLTYAGIALNSVLGLMALSGSVVPTSIFVLGAFMLLLSFGWHPIRRFMLQISPSAIRACLPSPSPAGIA